MHFKSFQLRCCGAVRFEDWKASRWYSLNKNRTLTVPDLCARKHNKAAKVPESCCKSASLNCGCSDHPNNIFYNVSKSREYKYKIFKCLKYLFDAGIKGREDKVVKNTNSTNLPSLFAYVSQPSKNFTVRVSGYSTNY